MDAITSAPSGHIGIGNRLGYSVGNLGKSVVLTVLDTFLLYYLVRFAGFSPLQAGGLLTAVMLWDGFADVAVAYLADRHGRANALGRLILVGAPLCAAGFWMIFAVPPADGRYAIAVAVVLCRTGYTMCDIGHNTLLVRIATTPRHAATVSGMRLLFSAMGAGLVGLATADILSASTGDRQAGFVQAATGGAVIYVVTLMIAAAATRRLSIHATRYRSATPSAIIGGLYRNRAYRNVLCLIALQAGLVPVFARALPFVGEAAHGGASWAGAALTVITLSQAVSLPLWMLLSRWQSPTAIIMLAYGAMLVALGLLATGIDGAAELAGLALIGIAQAGMNMAIWAMLAVSVRRGTADGVMNEALPIGLFLAVLKGSAGIGNGLLSASIAFGTGDAEGVTHVAIILPVLGCLAALFLILRYIVRPVAGALDPELRESYAVDERS